MNQKQRAEHDNKDNADQLAAANVSLVQAQNEAVRASKDIENASLIAPFSGTIVDVVPHRGDIVGSGSPAVSLVDLSK
jgi:multidrug resistance efflux pump